MSPGLFQNFLDGYRKPYDCPRKGSNSVVVMSVGSQSRRSQIESYGQPNFDFCFMNFASRIGGA